MMMRYLMIFFLFLLFLSDAKGQNITDTTTVNHSPRKAVLMSTFVPGLGQIYNRKYWKVPIIYAGLGGSAYAFFWNKNYYDQFYTALKIRNDKDSLTQDAYYNIYSDNNLLDIKNAYRSNMELSVIVFGVFYLLNIIDATVDAHLFDFKISDDLSMKWAPQLSPINSSAGITLQLRWK